ncbi:MAG: hypothetical protein ABW168_27355 [Sedimenticola sp.]
MILIYISGIDGCGKTTQSRHLQDWLKTTHHSAEYQWLRWEPSIIPILKKARKLLSLSKNNTEPGLGHTATEDKDEARWGNFKHRLLATRFFQSIWLHYATSDYYKAYRHKSCEWDSDFIILDRYLYDFIVDQAVNMSCSASELDSRLQKTRLNKMKRPDYFVYIDIPAEVGYERKMDGTPLTYLKKRGHLYKELANGETTLCIDGTQSPDAIHAEIRAWISNKLNITKSNQE